MQNKEENKKGFSRRDLLAGMAALPVLGAIGYGLMAQNRQSSHQNISGLTDLDVSDAAAMPVLVPGKEIRIGIVGCGSRGSYLLKSLGFVHPDRIDDWNQRGQNDPYWKKYLDDFRLQENLNVKVVAVCDIFKKNEERALKIGANIHRNGQNGLMGQMPQSYKTYQELLADPNVDAVIIATPDHLHVPIALEAARQNKHIYCEKPLSWTVEETYQVRQAIKNRNIVFQLGHQGRQTESYQVAKALIEKGILGKVSLIEVCTNRNDPNGAWVYDIDPEANEQTVDWQQFIGPAPWHPFSLERFFRWRCWWDYSTGLSGDLFTHEFDAMNQIFQLGIPNSAMASGGIYFYKDGRTVPDVLNMVYEYPERDLSLLYSASLSSEKNRGKAIMGHDAWMELGENLTVYADPRSTQYQQFYEQGILEPGKAMFTYVPGQGKVDAITTPTEKYFAGRGLLYTYRDGKALDTTHLHLLEWLNCIRQEKLQTSCNIDRAFEEAIAAHMGTISYHEKRRVYWDSDKEQIS